MRAHEGMKPTVWRWLACCAFLFLFLLGLRYRGLRPVCILAVPSHLSSRLRLEGLRIFPRV